MQLNQRAVSNGILGHQRLAIVSAIFGFLLWFPAIGVPFGPISLQPADILVVLSYPLILTYLPQVPSRVALVIFMSLISAGMATLNSGDFMILVYYGGFIAPFLLFVGIMCGHEASRKSFLRAFIIGSLVSALLFLAQLVFGAQTLDYRTNHSFSLAPQFKRGFALFPEVSTFATHMIYALGVLVVLWRSGKARPMFKWFRLVPSLLIVVLCLLLSRSSSVILVAPIVVVFAYFKGRSLTTAGLLGAVILAAIGVALLQVYLAEFYIDRAGNSAARSIGLRGISMISGISVLGTGDVFGVGLGNNHLITERAYEVAGNLGFTLILLPEGVNSFIIGRIFEEGWPAVLMFGLAGSYLLKSVFGKLHDTSSRALVLLALASMLVSLLVTGYRGIYMNWFWLAAAPALAASSSRSRSSMMQSGTV